MLYRAVVLSLYPFELPRQLLLSIEMLWIYGAERYTASRAEHVSGAGAGALCIGHSQPAQT